MTKFFAPRALLSAAALCCAALQPASAATIEVNVANVAGKGKVSVAVCDREHFLKQCAHNASVPAQAGSTTVTVADVPAGTWAILAYEDANDNGKLDRTLGIPTENWGMSRDAKANFGPPKFDNAAIEVKDDKMVVPIKLH
ncbi:uncharacterized protein (DUF2141 family) [Pseudoduganella flava]|uniref:DUF2141 domain-containing protein n=1 Tax=Pseudoduganella flava TaxID=871742 RepID=A0A562PLT5_9BURK|nr:DUF2141 domain-containing protein [Pseudoduganella flava]QGZ40975.1 DUF2141 domain-containing protein [Pseudoduganella flava]TWI45338.1 uncharacterized protein (DUF2141 family) [Pseudoduganella flava]